MPGFIGVPELLLLGLLALILFGPKRLPEMGRGLGKGMREFKDSLTGDSRDSAIHDFEPEETAVYHSLPTGTTVAEPAPEARTSDVA
jgi:sec-independent protein translocase protein TatA